VAGAHHDDERRAGFRFSQGPDVTAASQGLRAEDGAARVFPVGVGCASAGTPLRLGPGEPWSTTTTRPARACDGHVCAFKFSDP
jgi:hypothetical protein